MLLRSPYTKEVMLDSQPKLVVDPVPAKRYDGHKQFYLCTSCHASYHGHRLYGRSCLRCQGGFITFANLQPNPQPMPEHFMICDSCHYIITGRYTRKAHHDRCQCRTVHPIPEEPKP